MIELPPELAALSKAASDDQKRHAIGVAVAVVTLAGRARNDAVVGALFAGAMAAGLLLVGASVGWPVAQRSFGAAVAFCAIFPLATRVVRRLRFARVRRRFAHGHFEQIWTALGPELAAAWERATPGQRAALLLLTRSSA